MPKADIKYKNYLQFSYHSETLDMFIIRSNFKHWHKAGIVRNFVNVWPEWNNLVSRATFPARISLTDGRQICNSSNCDQRPRNTLTIIVGGTAKWQAHSSCQRIHTQDTQGPIPGVYSVHTGWLLWKKKLGGLVLITFNVRSRGRLSILRRAEYVRMPSTFTIAG